jgi:rod shape-determining protein MreD
LSSFRNRIHFARFIGPTWWVAGAWLLAALIVQVTLAHWTLFRSVEPSFVLIAVVWYSIRVDSQRAATFGLVAGLCEDILATGTGGAWTISTIVSALVARAISRGFFADSLPLAATVTAAITLVRNLIFWIVMGFEGYPSGLAMMHFHETLVQALVNSAAMLVVMFAARRFDEHFS